MIYIEEVCSESSRKMKDMEDTTSEASWNTVKKGKQDVWRPELEGEAVKPEAIGLVNEVKDVSVNPEGESGHRHARAKMARKERENQTSMKKKVNGKAPKDEGAQVQSPKKKSDSGGSRRNEFLAKRAQRSTMIFVLVCILCSANTLRFWQFASVVVYEKECYTANLC